MLNLGTIETFKDVKPDKAQALKVLEEAAEVVEAWKDHDRFMDTVDFAFGECQPKTKVALLDECADVIQAVSNLVAGLGVTDFTDHIRACEDRNRRRGRL